MLKRFRESLSMPNSFYSDITNDVSKELKESLDKVSSRLAESKRSDIDDAKKLLLESNVDSNIVKKVIDKLTENGISASTQRIYKLPVARINDINHPNGNHRVYERKLWENVMNNQRSAWYQGVGLCDHPSDDNDPGSFKNSSIVWLGMEIDPETNLVYGIGTFVGPYGHMAQEIIDVGGRVGFSSSGFGELMNDGMTVNPDTYQIERLADVVLNPSQDVYGEISDEQKNIEYTKQEPVITEAKSAIIKNKKIKESMEVTQMAENKVKTVLSKVEEKAFRNYVKEFLNEATGIKSPIDQMKELSEIRAMFDEGIAPDLKSEVEAKLVEKNDELQKLVNDAVAMKESLGVEDLATVTEGTKRVIEQGTLLKDQVADLETLCEGLQSRNKELVKENKSLKLKLQLSEKTAERESKRRNAKLVSNQTTVDELSEKLESAEKRLSLKTKAFNEKIASYKAGNEKLEKLNGMLESKLKTANEVINGQKNLKESKSEEVEKLRAENETLTGMVERLQKKNEELRNRLGESRAQTAEAKQQLEEATTPNYHVQPKFTERVGKYLNFRENEGLGVEKYWADQVARYGEALLPYEHQIRDAKTLREAQNAFLKVMPFVDADEAAVQAATFQGGNIAKERMNMLESAGMKSYNNDDPDRVNEEMLAKLKKLGLK